jgi:hypothetical protein
MSTGWQSRNQIGSGGMVADCRLKVADYRRFCERTKSLRSLHAFSQIVVRMDSKLKLLLKEEVYQIVGSGLEILEELGLGLNEKPYENALAVEVLL